MDNSNYVVIQGWMRTELKLKGNDLLVYAIIYGFSQSENQKFTGSLQYLADWCGATKTGIQTNLKNLLEKGLIVKEDNYINNVKFVTYYTTKLHSIQLSCTNNINNISNNKLLDINTNNSNTKVITVDLDAPKKNRFRKGVDIINDFTEDEVVRKALVEWFKLQLEIYNTKSKTFYLNTLKNRLGKLKTDFKEEEYLDVINYAIERQYQSFYPIPLRTNRNRFFADRDVESNKYDVEELDELKELEERRRTNGQRTKF